MDQASAPWGCPGGELPGAEGTVVGTGEQNTEDILDGCITSHIAARVASNYSLNGFSEWFLPQRMS